MSVQLELDGGRGGGEGETEEDARSEVVREVFTVCGGWNGELALSLVHGKRFILTPVSSNSSK